MTFGQYRTYLVLFVLVLGSWFLADLFEPEEIKGVKVVDHSPDYFSTGYYKKEMAENGMAKNELLADKMTHYSDDGTTHLKSPVMTLHNSDTPPWVIRSESGILEADGDNLLLKGKVFISRDAINKREAFEINTSNLRVKLSISYAETSEWAEIIDGRNRTEGVGLESTFVNPVRLKFLSRVKGRYEFN
jgi:lipopolysaccharide export system protein LptC